MLLFKMRWYLTVNVHKTPKLFSLQLLIASLRGLSTSNHLARVNFSLEYKSFSLFRFLTHSTCSALAALAPFQKKWKWSECCREVWMLLNFKADLSWVCRVIRMWSWCSSSKSSHSVFWWSLVSTFGCVKEVAYTVYLAHIIIQSHS